MDEGATPIIAEPCSSRIARISACNSPEDRPRSKSSLQRKTRRRLLGILRMYADYTDGGQGPLGKVFYVCGRADIADAVKRAAWDAGLEEGQTLSFRTMGEVVEQTCEAARHQWGTSWSCGTA